MSRLEKSTFSPYFFFLPRLRGAEESGMARYLRYELARNLPTNRNPMPITSFTNSYLEKKASATRISVSESSSAAFDLTSATYQSSIDICFSDSRVLKSGDWTAPSITHVCLLRLIAPIAIISRPRFTRCATPDQKRPMPYVSLPAFEMNDGSIATAMSSDGPKQSCAIPMLTFIQSTDVLKLEAKVLAVRPP